MPTPTSAVSDSATPAEDQVKYPRGQQPRCAWRDGDDQCNHSLSFHGGKQKGKCHTMGCKCPGWVD